MAQATLLSILQSPEVYTFQWHAASGQPSAAALYAIVPRNAGLEAHLQEQFAELAHLFNRFAHPASPPTGDADHKHDPLQSVGRLLFAHLLPSTIQQALRLLSAGSALTIATNDATIPWELVHDGENYLALKFALTRQVLATTSRQQPQPLRHSRWSTLLIGNPTGDLPQATQEIEQLSQLIESIPETARPRLLVRHRATKALVLQELASGRYDLVHYSGHALFNATQPAATGLLLAENEVLTLREIAEQLSGHPIIFLNGCESARGQAVSAPSAGDDAGLAYLGSAAQGLATAFIQGGAQAFIGTFWPILDAGSQTFALHFYRLAIQGVALHEALRRTRQQLWRANPQDPLWASYSLYGDPTLPILSAANYAIRPVTTLLARLTGVPTLYQRLGLERAAELEQTFINQVADVVQQYGGNVVDATLPLIQIRFGVPIAQEDNATRTLHTALTLRKLVEQLNRMASAHQSQALTLHCGISSDQALTRQVVNASARLSSNSVAAAFDLALGAGAGEIWADETTHRQAQRAFHFEQVVADATASGTDAAPIWRVQSPLHPSSAPAAPIVAIGRERELRQLIEWWQEVAPTTGRLVGIVGVPGVGKTYLIQALQSQLAGQPHQWLQVTCHVFGQERVYAVLAQIIYALTQITPDDQESIQRAKLTELVRATIVDSGYRLEDHLEETLALAGRVVGLHFSSPTIDTLDPELRQKRLVGVGQAVLRYQAQKQPLVLVLDDLQWADEASLAVLQPLVNGLSQLPILVLAIHRPEWSAGWTHSPHYRHLPLGLLLAEAQHALLADLLQTSAIPASLEQTILQRTGGNPFFITEVVMALQESAALLHTDDGWTLAKTMDGMPLPETVESLVQSRLDRLSAISREVLERAAVIGQEFDHQLLAAVQEEPVRSVLDRSVNELAQRDFIQTAFGFTVNYAFSHGIIHQTVYSRLVEQTRRAFHRLVAQVLLGLSRKPDVERLAHHYYHSNDRLPAIRYCLAAAQHAADQWSNSTAIRWYERAWEWLQSFISEPPTEGEEQEGATAEQLLEWQITALEGRAEVQAAIGENEAAIAGYQAALDLLANVPHFPANTHAALHRKLAIAHHNRGDFAAAWTILKNALALLADGRHDESSRLYYWLGMVAFRRGEVEEGLVLSQQGVAISSALGNTQDIAQAYNLQGIIYLNLGRAAASVQAHEASIAAYRQCQYEPGLMRAYCNLGVAYQYMSQWPAALAQFQQSAALSEKIGELWWQIATAINMGEVYRKQGELPLAIETYTRALHQAEAFGMEEAVGLAQMNLGATYLKQGDLTAAGEYLAQSHQTYEQIQITIYLPELLRYQAELSLELSEPDRALALAQQASQLAQTLDQSQLGQAHRVLGQTYQQLGELAVAKTELEQSLALLQEQQLPYEVGLTLLALAQLTK